jgi:transcriptional regulator with XRE-family HTH domain
MTQEQLAAAVGVKPAVISHYETDRREPSMRALRRLCEALLCDATILLGSGPIRPSATCPYCDRLMTEIDCDDTNDPSNPRGYYACCYHCDSRGPLVAYAGDAMMIARCRGNAVEVGQMLAAQNATSEQSL